MRSEFMPQIKLSVQQMTANMVQCIGVEGSDYGEYVKASIEKAVNEIDYDTIIKAEITLCVHESIKAYFSYGQGQRKVKDAVGTAMDKLKLEGE